MEKFIEKQLKRIKSIKADSAYFERSFQKITATNQHSGLFSVFGSKLSYSIAGVALAIFMVFISLNTVSGPTSSGSVASLSGEDLSVEASDADFKIQVQEASYFSNSAEKVASALDEIASE